MTYYGATEPKYSRFYFRNRKRKGDLWFDTSNRNAVHVFDGTGWKKLTFITK